MISYSLLNGDNVLAIESYDAGGVAAMTAQLEDASGNKVGTSQVNEWKVFIADNQPNSSGYNSNSLVFPSGWNTVDFDSSDSSLWKVPQKVSDYTNPWGNKSGDPVWIWSGDDQSDANNHDAVLFRYEFSTLSSNVDSSGNWSFTVDSNEPLTDGSYAVTAKATDAAGNESGASAALTITIDSSVPSAPSTPDLAPSSDTGSSNTDNITGDTTPTFTGTAEAGSAIELFAGSSSC